MNIQVNIENAVSSFSCVEKKIIYSFLSILDLSKDKNDTVVNLKSFAEKSSFHRSMVVNCVRLLCYLGVISTSNRGTQGTHITVDNAKACRMIRDLSVQ